MAFLIDTAILIVVDLILVELFNIGAEDYSYLDESFGPTDFISIVVNLLYYTIGVSVWSTTVGKRVMGLYVLRPNGARLGAGRAMARWFATIPSALLLGVGYIMIGVRSDKRGLHDLICDTVVVKR